MPAARDLWLRRGLKSVVFLACLVPFAGLVHGAVIGDLGANPVERVTDVSGQWGLRLLLVTLAITPLRRLTGWNGWMSLRRMLGLFAFFYVTLHLLTWIGLDQGFDLASIGADIVKRPYVTVGFAAWLLLLPLALTSTRGMMRRLGRNWQRLHRAVYPAAALGILHHLWQVRADPLEPLIYAAVLAALLLLRWRPGLIKPR